MQEASVVAIELAHKLEKYLKDVRFRIGLIIFGILFFSMLIGLIFSSGNKDDGCVFRIPRSAIRPETEGDAQVLSQCVTLGHVTSQAGQTLGLSGQESLPKDKGLLFVYQDIGEKCIWMKDMKFSLDVIWLNEDQDITYIRENLSPDTYPKIFCGPNDTKYVIEVNAGIVGAADLHVGQRLKL